MVHLLCQHHPGVLLLRGHGEVGKLPYNQGPAATLKKP
jgi:hypothetical protein